MNLCYKAYYEKKGDLHYLSIPELSLIVSGTDIDHVYQELAQKKESYFQAVSELDSWDTVPYPAEQSIKHKFSERSIFENSLLYIIKAAIIGLFIFIPIKYGIESLKNGVIIETISKEISKSMSTVFSEKVTLFASMIRKDIIQASVPIFISAFEIRLKQHTEKYRNMSPEEKEEFRRAVREYVQGIKPVIDEVRVLWEE